MSQKPTRRRTSGGRSEPRGIDQAGELIDPKHTPAADDLSSTLSAPDSKAGRLQRACLDLLREHHHKGDIPTNGRFLFYELEQRGVIPKKYDGINPATGKKWARTPLQDVSVATMHLRDLGLVPWHWIEDETHRRRSAADRTHRRFQSAAGSGRAEGRATYEATIMNSIQSERKTKMKRDRHTVKVKVPDELVETRAARRGAVIMSKTQQPEGQTK